MKHSVYNKKDFLNHLELIKPSGYTLNSDGFYVKQEASRKIEIFFGTAKYFPHSVVYRSISVFVSFPAVEQILYQVWSQLPEPKFGYSQNYSPTFHKGFGKNVLGETKYSDMGNFDVEDDASFTIIRQNLDDLIDASVAFVNQYSTLQDLYNYGETMAIQDRANFYAQPLPYRAMIIKKLLKTSDYSLYSDHIVKKHTNVNPNPEKAAFSLALKTHLDNL